MEPKGPVLGLESSCDETAAALLAPDGRVLAEALLSQVAEHARFGGVVPEVAARAHLHHMPHLAARVFEQAGIAPAALGGGRPVFASFAPVAAGVGLPGDAAAAAATAFRRSRKDCAVLGSAMAMPRLASRAATSALATAPGAVRLPSDPRSRT